MPTRVNLLMSDEQMKAFEQAVDNNRKRIVKVDREALDQLLIDYGVMRNAIRDNRGTFILNEPEPTPHRRRTLLRV